MKLWKKSMVWALCLAMSIAAASCFGTESESSGSDVSESVASSTESVTSESTPEEPEEGGEEGGETPGGDQGGEEGGETPGGNEGGEEGGEQGGETEKVMCTVTFKQEGCEDIVKTVEQGTALTDIPTPVAKDGYTVVWDVVDFSNIADNMEVTAEAIANIYWITYDAKGGSMEASMQPVTFNEEYTVEAPATREYYTFGGWYVVEDGVVTDTEFVGGTWTTVGDVEVAAKWTFEEGEYSMKYNFNVADYPLTQITKAAYPGGSTVSFKYYIPEGTTPGWWGIAWNTDADKADNYNAAGIYADGTPYSDYYALGSETGAWTKVQFTLPEDGEYYLYFGSEMGADAGNWLLGEGNSYALIEDFKIGDVTEDFNKGIDDSIFAVNVAGAVSVGEGYSIPTIEEGEYALKYMFNTDGVSMITKKGYPGGSKVSFKYYIPGDAVIDDKNWWGVAWHNEPEKADMYHPAGIHDAVGYKSIKYIKGSWVDFEFTIEGDANTLYYIYFGSNVGNWNMPDGTDAYVLFDDFTVNGETDNFNQHIDACMFDVLKGGKVVLSEKGEGYFEIPFEAGEYAMKYVCNASGETVSQVTKKAYAGGSKVSFQYYIPEGTVTSWWGIAWSKTNSGLDIYATADSSKGYQPTKVLGEWTTVEFTLPESGEYYLYFGSEIGAAHGRWMLNGENAYILIDNFKVSGEGTEDFNKPLEECAFDVLFPSAVTLSDKDAGIENTTPDLPEIEEPTDAQYGAKIFGNKISGTASTPTFITKEAYTFAEDTTITFNYYMSGNTAKEGGAWWSLCWAADQKNASIYAHASGTGQELSTAIQDTWTTATVTVPAGTWYLYIGMEKGQWGDGYVIIDNFQIGDIYTETFDKGIDKSIFVVSPFSSHHAAVEVAGGYVEAVIEESEYAMKYIFGASGEAVSQVTKKAYAGGSKVSFRYYIPAGTTVGNWWGLAYKNTKEGLSIYDAAGSSKFGLGMTIGEWVYVEFTLPEGDNYYLYFGAPTGEWKDENGGNAYVLIDDFTVGGEVENFNKGMKESCFEVLVDGAVTEGEGYLPVSLGAKITMNLISSTASTPSFITAQKYAGGTTVTFDYYIADNTLNKWWTFNWTTDNTVASLYAFVENNPNQAGIEIDAKEQGVWKTITIEIPEGEWYFYFAGAVGEWGDGYVIIDNFKIGDTLVADFDDGTYGIFLDNRDSKPDAIVIANGKND